MKSPVDDIDNNLALSLQKGDEQAFKLLFDKYASRLYQFSFKCLKEKEEAEDIVHDVFMKIWQNRQSLKCHSSFRAYLFTIAYNAICQRFLKRSREEKYVKIFALEYLDKSSLQDDQLDYRLFVERVNALIDLLPPKRKEVFVLSFRKELKNEAIARQLAVSEQFVKNQLLIARKFIVDNIKKDNRPAGIFFLYLFGVINH